jgi:hypothetical protein
MSRADKILDEKLITIMTPGERLAIEDIIQAIDDAGKLIVKYKNSITKNLEYEKRAGKMEKDLFKVKREFHKIRSELIKQEPGRT